MNLIWTIILFISIIIITITNPQNAFNLIITGSQKAIDLSLKLWAIYAVWLGIIRIIEDTKLTEKIAKLLSPIIKKLFGKQNAETKKEIAINLTANLLGMGNACVPSGIKATTLLSGNKKTANKNVIMFIILNTTSLQLLPTTIIGLRTINNSINASNIIMPSLISTICSTLVGIILVCLCEKLYKVKL